MPKSQDDLVLYSDLTREIRSAKRFMARSLRLFGKSLDAKLEQRFLEFEAHMPNGELSALRSILPELEEMANARRRSEQGRAWLSSLVPGWISRWIDRVLTAVVVGLILYAGEHGWLTWVIHKIGFP